MWELYMFKTVKYVPIHSINVTLLSMWIILRIPDIIIKIEIK